jgi:hypothetical protein
VQLRLLLSTAIALFSLGISSKSARALPPPEEIPEEILRVEILTEARSPLNGEPLSAAEYAELRARLAERGFPPEVAPNLRQLIFMLELRRLINTFSPIPLL